MSSEIATSLIVLLYVLYIQGKPFVPICEKLILTLTLD